MIDPLPEGYFFRAVGLNGVKTWKIQAPRIVFETPDGPIELGCMDGHAYIRTFNLQGRAGIGGPDNTVMLIFGEQSNA